MRLTRKLAIEITISLWTWLAEEDGRNKWDWPGWEKYGEMLNRCPLCEYTEERDDETCNPCPYLKKFGACDNPGTPFSSWCGEPLKVHAQAFLEQIKGLR